MAKKEIPQTIFVVEKFADQTIVTPTPNLEVAGRIADQSEAPHGEITKDPDGKEYIHKW